MEALLKSDLIKSSSKPYSFNCKKEISSRFISEASFQSQKKLLLFASDGFQKTFFAVVVAVVAVVVVVVVVVVAVVVVADVLLFCLKLMNCFESFQMHWKMLMLWTSLSLSHLPHTLSHSFSYPLSYSFSHTLTLSHRPFNKVGHSCSKSLKRKGQKFSTSLELNSSDPKKLYGSPKSIDHSHFTELVSLKVSLM